MKFGKIVNGQLEYAPRYLRGESETVVNPTDEMYFAAGYKRVLAGEPPQGGYISTAAEETETEIRIIYIIEESEE